MMYVRVNIPPITKRQLHSIRRSLGDDAANYVITRNLQDCEITSHPPDGNAGRRGVAILGQLSKACKAAGVDLPHVHLVVLPDDRDPQRSTA